MYTRSLVDWKSSNSQSRASILSNSFYSLYIYKCVEMSPVKFTYLGSSVSSTEEDIDTRLTKAGTAVVRLSIIWKSDLTDKMKRIFFQAAVVSILLYRCTAWTLTKRMEKKLDGNYTRMLQAILNNPGSNTPQATKYTATCLPSRKLSRLDEPDMQNTAREVRTSL